MSGVYKPLVIAFGVGSVLLIMVILRRMDKVDQDHPGGRNAVGHAEALLEDHRQVGEEGVPRPHRGECGDPEQGKLPRPHDLLRPELDAQAVAKGVRVF